MGPEAAGHIPFENLAVIMDSTGGAGGSWLVLKFETLPPKTTDATCWETDHVIEIWYGHN